MAKTFLLTIASVLLTVFAVNAVFDYLQLDSPRYHYSQYPYQLDKQTGYRLKPNLTGVRASVTRRKKIVSRTEFSTDEWGRRTSPQKEKSQKTRHLILFGCSFVFGEGLQWSETIMANIAKLNPEIHPYAYAASGYGPNQMLRQLQQPEFKKEINEDKGVGIYLYINDHLNRVVPSLSKVNPSPRFERSGDQLNYQGLQTDWLNGPAKVARWFLTHSSLLQFFGVDIEQVSRQEKQSRLCSVIDASAKIFHREFENSRFLVALAPLSRHEDLSEIKACLESKGIEYLDATNDLLAEEQWMQIDGLHYTAPTVARLSAALVREADRGTAK